MGSYIQAIGHYLPARVVTNDDLAKIVDTSDAWIFPRTGIKSRRVTDGENTSDLAYQAALQALERAEIDKEAIDAVILATFTADAITPSTACLVASKLGLKENVLAFDLNAACSGLLYAMEVADALLASGRYLHILVIGAEVISKFLDWQDRSTCILFGDGAAAMVLSHREKSCMGYRKFFRKADDHQVLFASSVPLSNHVHALPQDSMKIQMKGQEVFRFAIEAIQKSLQGYFEATGQSISEVDYVVLHQANDRIIQHVAKKYKGSEDKFISLVERYANTSAASIGMALSDMDERGLLKRGMRLILIGFGAGLTWGIVELLY